MQCREQAMEESTAVTVFGTDKYNMAVKRGNYFCFRQDECWSIRLFLHKTIAEQIILWTYEQLDC